MYGRTGGLRALSFSLLYFSSVPPPQEELPGWCENNMRADAGALWISNASLRLDTQDALTLAQFLALLCALHKWLFLGVRSHLTSLHAWVALPPSGRSSLNGAPDLMVWWTWNRLSRDLSIPIHFHATIAGRFGQ